MKTLAALLLLVLPLTAHAQKWHGSVKNVTESQTVTLLVPPVTGQYELKIYSSIAQPDVLGQSIYTFTFNWYDPGPGPESAIVQQLAGKQTRPTAYSGNPGSVSTFLTAKGTPITLDISKSVPDLSVATVYWTIEFLQPAPVN